MNPWALSVLSVLAVSLAPAPSPSPKPSPSSQPAHLLVVTVTKGFRHQSIPDLERLVAGLASESGAFDADHARTDDELAAKTTAAALARYDGVVFASTTGDLPLADRDGFISWIEAGHGLVGLHAATDTFHGFPPYLDLIGGEFEHHGPQTKVHVLVADRTHPATRALGASFDVFDEIYQFKRFDPARVHLLLSMDKHPETGAAGSFPLAWTREPGRGRVFYTAFGHREDVIAAPWFRQHVLGGIRWVLGRT